MIIKIKKMNILAFFFFSWYAIAFGTLDYYHSKEE